MSKIVIIVCVLIALCSCHDGADNPYKELSIDSFSTLKADKYAIDAKKIRININKLSYRDGISLTTDRFIRNYYSNEEPFIWISRIGVYDRADSLIQIIKKADRYGIDKSMLRVTEIEKDLKCFRTLDVSSGKNDINHVMARLEYNLTKAYLRYLTGIKFGFINPDHLYNNLEKDTIDSINTRYRQLSELRVERPDNDFFRQMICEAFNDNINKQLSEIHPKSILYEKLINRLNNDKLSYKDRMKTNCNIERCRWRFKILSGQNTTDKLVEVNIPSYSLMAKEKDHTLSMRVACGTIKHKTPLLSSKIVRMDINPQWIIPKSIAKGFIGRHEYMHKMGMFVIDKKEGKLPAEMASYKKLMEGEQYIVQAGGPKNSLGRIIFRFDNGFSVFLHDTSSPWLFQRTYRALSHGCVRVEKPYELAIFLLNDKDEKLEDKLKYSMTVEFVNDNDSIAKQKKVKIDRKRIINSLSVKPAVPLVITYYTIYFNNKGELIEYQDVYGYDKVLADKLDPFVK